MRLVGIVICLAALTACSSDSPSAPSGPIDVQIVLAPGQAAPVPSTSIGIRFQGVPGDSRCPGDATCIQAGDAIVRVEALGPSGAAEFELHTATLQPAHFQDFTITLAALSPYPFASLPPIAPVDYRATFRITR